jgi:hypothetical protein
MWPARRPSKPDNVLNDDELIDAKRLFLIYPLSREKMLGAPI